MARGEYLGAKEFNKRLRELMARVENSLPELGEIVASEISQKAVQNAKNNIERGTNMEGHSEFTPELTEKLRGGGTENILDESGMLKDSIYVVDKLFNRDSIIVVIGSYMPYAGYHEEGFNAKIPGVKGTEAVPARPFLKPGVEKAIKDAFSFGLEARVRRALDAKVRGRSWKKFFK
jgi:phage gpG-like protein